MCQAIVDDLDYAKTFNLRRMIVSPGDKPCSRKAVEHVGHLHLCKVHARMAREGLVEENGRVAPKVEIALVRRYPKKFPHGLYDWVRKLA